MHGWSKTTRISVMMALDTVFLIIELGVGYWVSSLALIADAFHMLNDIISLAVGLWAVNLARKESNDRYSYGWLRAEILGAFFNATFLIGLCVTIVLEAIQRFFDPPVITNPQVILLVGCFGLLSNLVGFWVLGGHGHSHGHEDLEAGHDHEGEHEHVHGDEHEDEHDHDHDLNLDDESCHEEEDEAAVATAATAATAAVAVTAPSNSAASHAHTRSVSRGSLRSKATTAVSGNSSANRTRANSSRPLPATIDDISIHPASFRQDIREIITGNRSRSLEEDSEETEESSSDEATVNGGTLAATETTPLLAAAKPSSSPSESAVHTQDHQSSNHHSHHHTHTKKRRDSHGGHHHNQPKKASAGAHGHSHGDMGMNAMILHVMGDALGNIGVIVTALIIWQTEWRFRYYADPCVSLLITLIILKTAIPLTKATSKILLQATPDHIDINDIREDIQDLEGVLSCHHIHVWQLSDSQLVASLHIEMAYPAYEYGSARYMALARRVRKCLHAYGIHGATIQPEFRVGPNSSERGRTDQHSTAPPAGRGSPSPSSSTANNHCLLDCVDNCVGQGCCAKASSSSQHGSRNGSPPGSSHSH